MTGCNYPNWNLARTHLLFAKRATGVSTKAGRPAEAAGFGGWGIGTCSPTAPPNRAPGQRRRRGEPAPLAPPAAPLCLHLAPGHHGLSETSNFRLQGCGFCRQVLLSLIYVCLSVWPSLYVSPTSRCFSLIIDGSACPDKIITHQSTVVLITSCCFYMEIN